MSITGTYWLDYLGEDNLIVFPHIVPLSGIYVKIYLKGKSKSNKRKTRVVQACDPCVFRQLIKYDGSLVDNKSLEVSVWQSQGGLKGKAPIGFTEIKLGDVDLTKLNTSWYNLHPMDILCSSSFDD